MEKIIACCGLSCHRCPIYLASRPENTQARKTELDKMVHECRGKYGVDYQPAESLECDGCPSDGPRHFFACSRCSIRACARQRGLANCAGCPQFACDCLKIFFEIEPEAETTLKEMRSEAPIANDSPNKTDSGSG